MRLDVVFSLSPQKSPRWYCNICQKNFLTKQQMEKHILALHNAKEIQCAFCELRFSTQTLKIEHISNVHECNQNYNFSTIGILKNHIDKHHNQETIQCGLCDKPQKKYYINEHINKCHSIVKKYHCNMCDKTFITK